MIAALITDTVTAEDAPVGVQLWPTRHPKYAPNFTLATVEVITRRLRDAHGEQEISTVVWTYESGNVRTFRPGEQVAFSRG